jgi:hypothetical protein
MNIYLVVEGFGEKKVYNKWVRYLNPRMRFVDSVEKVTNNHIYLISGMGYPYYFEIIDSAIEDIKSKNIFDRLVVSVDSEEMTYEEKLQEIEEHLQGKNIGFDYKVIIQHFCLETWALGNKSIVSRNSTSERVQKYRTIFDVLENDPELLPNNPEESCNRAQFAERYLRALFNEKYRNLTYTKNNTNSLLNRKYYKRVKQRMVGSRHINSFNDFLTAFN